MKNYLVNGLVINRKLKGGDLSTCAKTGDSRRKVELPYVIYEITGFKNLCVVEWHIIKQSKDRKFEKGDLRTRAKTRDSKRKVELLYMIYVISRLKNLSVVNWHIIKQSQDRKVQSF